MTIKITPEIKSKFQDAIKKTKDTGREHGFYLCIDNKQKLSTSKLQSGMTHQIKLESPLSACPGKKIQGDFHTHTYLTAIKKIKPNLTDKQIKDLINRNHKSYIEEMKEIGIKQQYANAQAKATPLANNDYRSLTIDSPSPKDLLKEILYKCVGISKGTTCVISDMGNDKLECWTVKNSISDSNMQSKDCTIAYNKLFKDDKEKELVKYDKHILSLFDKETILLKKS